MGGQPLTLNKYLKPALFWFFATFILFLMGNWSHAVWDRDEPRYCVATHEMIRYGDWVVPTFNRELRYDKPPFTYWAMMGPFMVFGENEFAARFPSALFGAGRVAVLFLFAIMLGCSLRGAHLAALAGATTVLLQALSKAATTDSMLLFTVVAAMALFWAQQVYGFSWWRHLAFYAMMGLSVLVKGPPGPLFCGLGIVLYWAWMTWKPGIRDGFAMNVLPWKEARRPERFRKLVSLAGGAMFFLVALPWAVMVTIRTKGDFLSESIGRHVVDRAREPLEGHSGPFFYYLPIIPAVMLPLTAILVLAAIWGWKNRHLAQVRFLATWFIPGFIIISAVSTKLPHYTAPLLPALCLLLGLWWTRREVEAPHTDYPRTRKTGAVIMGIIGLLVPIALPIAPGFIELPVSIIPFLVTGLLIGGVLIAGAVLLWMNRVWESSWTWSAGLSVALVIGVLWPLAIADSFRPSKNIAHWMRENLPEDTRLLTARYQEPSMYFYWGDPVTEVRARQWEEGIAYLADTSERRAFVTMDTHWETWQKNYRGAHDGAFPEHLEVIHSDRFYQFEAGRWITLVVVRNWQDHEGA